MRHVLLERSRSIFTHPVNTHREGSGTLTSLNYFLNRVIVFEHRLVPEAAASNSTYNTQEAVLVVAS